MLTHTPTHTHVHTGQHTYTYTHTHIYLALIPLAKSFRCPHTVQVSLQSLSRLRGEEGFQPLLPPHHHKERFTSVHRHSLQRSHSDSSGRLQGRLHITYQAATFKCHPMELW